MAVTHRDRARRARGPATRTTHRPVPARLLLPTERADLRLTWHEDTREFVLSLWHGDDCVGTAPLPPSDAAGVASFIVTRLGEEP